MARPPQFHMGGQKVGPFLLESLQYHGDHGPLYRASAGEKVYAVKLLNSRLGKENPRTLEKWKALEHRRVARVVAVGESDGQPYVAGEWLDGGFLNDELELNPLAPQRILMLIRAIAEGLKVLHSLELAHGNLKAENVFVGSPESSASIWVDEVKLLDPALLGWTDAEKKTPAGDVAACKELLRRMISDGEGAPPPAMSALFDAKSAAELEAACTACYEQLSEPERTSVRVRKPIEAPPPMPMPMPTNWSPPPQRPQFVYTPITPRPPITNPSPPPPPDPMVDRKRWWMFWK
jgi:hypothetical protein